MTGHAPDFGMLMVNFIFLPFYFLLFVIIIITIIIIIIIITAVNWPSM